ncbi:MAG: alpha/beta hydrolase [Candidatus Saccharibacteria bacterium]|nr:alpha/beta hydrolase [Candidatus Saccharibacteria bacterium]
MERVSVKVGPYIVHLRTLISGNKTQILLVHGLGVSGDYYIKYAEKLAPYYDVYIIDLPGYGKTPKPPKPLTILELSDVVLKYISNSEIKECIIVGQSMGCQIVAHVIVGSPHLFSRAILLAPTTNKKERGLFIQGFRLWQDTFHEKLSVTFIVFTNYIRMGLRRFLVTSRYMIEDHIEDVLKLVKIPVLIVYGSKDKIAPREWGEFLASITYKGAAIEMRPAPHLLHYQKPDELVKITRRFTDI